MTPQEITAIRDRHGLSIKDFALALNLPADGRQVRRWEKGMAKGQPYAPTGSSVAAIRFLDAILSTLAESPPARLKTRLEEVLPEHMRGSQ